MTWAVEVAAIYCPRKGDGTDYTRTSLLRMIGGVAAELGWSRICAASVGHVYCQEHIADPAARSDPMKQQSIQQIEHKT